MRNTYLTPLLTLALFCGSAQAAMFGDVMIPDSLSPQPQAAAGHNNRTAVAVYPPEGTPFILYIPSTTRDPRPWSPLQSIAHELSGKGEVHIFNLGGRPWFGSREMMSGSVVFYDGYTHRNGITYNIAFSIDDTQSPDAAIKNALSRIRVIPGLNGSPAMPDASLAADFYDLGEWDEMAAALERAVAVDPHNWYIHYLQGRLAEGEGDFAAAREHYLSAAALRPTEVEPAIRAAATLSLAGGDGGTGSSELLSLAAAHTEEASVWEELGRVYLAAGETETAKAYFEEAASVNPASEIALYNLSFIHAEASDYENALRRGREFMYYYSWMPPGVVPDVTGAPGMSEDRIREIMSEPLPLGRIGRIDGQQLVAQTFTVQEVQEYCTLITVPETYVIYEQPEIYAPIVVYDWGWSPRWYRPWRPGSDNWFHRPRPPIHRPGTPGFRPPIHRPGRPPIGGGHRPPNIGPGNRPPGNRPPGGGPGGGPGNRPPGQGGQRPPVGGSGPGQGSRPPERPGQGSRPPERPGQGSRPPERPGQGSGSSGRPGAVQPAPMPTPPVTGTPERPRPERPGQNSRPSRPETVQPIPAPAPTPPSGGETPERPSPPERPGQGSRPSAPEVTRPTPPTTVTPERPRPSGRPGMSGGESRPSSPRPEVTRPSRPEGGSSRPNVTQPQPRPQPPTTVTPAPSRPEPRPTPPSRPSRPEPSRPATPPAQPQRPSRPAPSQRPSAPEQPRERPSRPAPNRESPRERPAPKIETPKQDASSSRPERDRQQERRGRRN